MSDRPDLRELLGPEVPEQEFDRLRSVHEALLAAGPLPELGPALSEPPATGGREGLLFFLPRRRLGAALLLAAALAAIAFGGGYFAGHRGHGFKSSYTVVMHGTGTARTARASILVGGSDSGGNVKLLMRVRGLRQIPGRGYYELYLTKGHRLILSCGTFDVAAATKTTEVRLSVPYRLKKGLGWVVTSEKPGQRTTGPTVLST